MTIECRETRFGRQVGEPHSVESGTEEWLNLNMGLNMWRSIIGQAIRIDSPSEVTVTDVISPLVIPHTYKEGEINELNLKTSPLVKLKDLVLWRRRHYSWREDK